MQTIELYIEGQRVDMFKDESISITQSIQNVKDISKIFTDFTKTFSVPASKVNNKIFKHYYNFDIQNGFDGRTKKDAVIELNTLPFRNGKIKLEGVDLKNNIPHTYKITFFGSTVTLKDLLGEDKLQSLDLTSYNQVYNAEEVRVSLFKDPASNDVIVPLITHTQRLFYGASNDHTDGNLHWHSGDGSNYHGVLYSDLKYAIRVDAVIQAIATKYNLTFSDDFFNSSNEHYYNLFLWLHRKKGAVENVSGINQSIISAWDTTSLGDTLTQMISNTTLRVSGDINRYDNYGLSLTSTTTSTYRVSLQKDGVEVYNTGNVTGSVTIEQTDFTIEQGDYTAIIESESNILFSQIEWDIEYRTIGGVVENDTYTITAYTFISQFDFLINQQIPEMKTIDFLTGIFKMFNLTAYVDKNSEEIIIDTLDGYYKNYYYNYNFYDITKYIDVNKSSVNVALPYREINFKYDGTKTFLSSRHTQLFGKEWSKSSYVGDEKLDGGIYDIKLPFEHLKYERLLDVSGNTTTIQYGYFVDDNEDSYFDKPLLFYPILQTGGTAISFLNSESSKARLTSYNIPSNSVSINSGTNKKNINFYNEVNEYTFDNAFTDTLFEVFYKKYITNVFNKSNRITKVTAYLPLRILLNYTLADRFKINGKTYKINSINTNLETGKSELELLNEL